MTSSDEEDLHDEVVELEWVVIKQNSAGVSSNLEDETTDHTDHETPSFVSDAESEMHDQEQAEDSSIDDITSKRGKIFDLSTGERARIDGARVVASVGHVAKVNETCVDQDSMKRQK